MKKTLVFSLKVWLTTIVIAPFIFGIIQVSTDTEIYRLTDVLVGLFYCVPAGIVLCLPLWSLFWLFTTLINKMNSKIIVKKIALSIVMILLIMLTFCIINSHALFSPDYWPSVLPMVFSYLGVGILCVWCYPLKPGQVEI
jgi:hypothetical protein